MDTNGWDFTIWTKPDGAMFQLLLEILFWSLVVLIYSEFLKYLSFYIKFLHKLYIYDFSPFERWTYQSDAESPEELFKIEISETKLDEYTYFPAILFISE